MGKAAGRAFDHRLRCARARSASPGSLCVRARVRVRVCARACTYVCVRLWGGAGRRGPAPAPPRPRPRPGQAGIFPPSRMGDAESCLLRQQTREVRKKPLINYCFLRAVASAELRALVATRLACRRRAPRTASSDTQPRRGARSADPAGQRSSGRAAPGEWKGAQRRGRPRYPREREPVPRNPLSVPALHLAPTSSPPSAPILAPLSPPREGRRVACSDLLARLLLFPWRKGSGF